MLVIIIHAFGSSPDRSWYRWLASSLLKKYGSEMNVEVLEMTNPQTPTIDAWTTDLLRRLQQEVPGVDKTPRPLFLIGHSVGCNTIIRALTMPSVADLLALHPSDTTDTPSATSMPPLRLAGCLCVAAWFSVVDPWEEMKPWCEVPIDFSTARRILDCMPTPLTVLLSTNDRYTPDFAANGKMWQDALGSEVVVIGERGHFGSKEQPEVLAAMEKLIDTATNQLNV